MQLRGLAKITTFAWILNACLNVVSPNYNALCFMRYSKAAALTSTMIPGTNNRRNVVIATTTLNFGASTKTRMAEKAG